MYYEKKTCFGIRCNRSYWSRVRRKVDLKHEKLNVHVIDFTNLDNYRKLVSGDVLFSALGTTLADAGSKENQYLVDFSYQFDFAKIAADNEVGTLSLVSSLGANDNSIFFYTKMKGKLEQAWKIRLSLVD